jgi:ligand-binding sensor domain-containing protein
VSDGREHEAGEISMSTQPYLSHIEMQKLACDEQKGEMWLGSGRIALELWKVWDGARIAALKEAAGLPTSEFRSVYQAVSRESAIIRDKASGMDSAAW